MFPPLSPGAPGAFFGGRTTRTPPEQMRKLRARSRRPRLRVWRHGLVRCSSSQRFALREVGAAVHDQPRHQDEKQNCGGDRPPVVLRVPWIGPAAMKAITRAASVLKRGVWQIHGHGSLPREKRLKPGLGSGPAARTGGKATVLAIGH